MSHRNEFPPNQLPPSDSNLVAVSVGEYIDPVIHQVEAQTKNQKAA